MKSTARMDTLSGDLLTELYIALCRVNDIAFSNMREINLPTAIKLQHISLFCP